jgi:3',5'-cyclic AMP phosphodiesterase CpdA
MTTLVHLSDLHFGTEQPDVVAALEARLVALRPTLVAVSGDLTQRATVPQFERARAFLDRLHAAGMQTLVVPGNHDLPLWAVGERLARPLARYRRHVGTELCPAWSDDSLVVQGLNSARRLTGKNGRISAEQARLVARTFSVPPLRDPRLRVVVVHHPLLALPWGPGGRELPRVHGAAAALDTFVACGVHLVLSGHHHRRHAGEAVAARTPDRSLLVVQAATATSRRTRDGHGNGFNVLEARLPELKVRAEGWTGSEFTAVAEQRFVRRNERWREG